MSTSERDIAMNYFRELKSRILVTTNLLSRGIDVINITLVINYELPMISTEKIGQKSEKKVDFDTYLHRVGRTGRFHRLGVSVNLITSEEQKEMEEEIMEWFKNDIKTIY